MENTRSSQIQDPGATQTEYTRPARGSVPIHYGDPFAEYSALENGAALVERHQSVLRLAGKDPSGMLDAILTNDVPEENHQGVYAALLDPKGRVQTDLRVLKDEGGLLVVTEPEGAEAVRVILGRYAPFSRVTLEDFSESETPWVVLGLYGPGATGLLGGPELKEHETRVLEVGGASLLVAGVRYPLGGYDLFCPLDDLQEVRGFLAGKGAVPAGLQAYETARIEAGTPRFGPDITPENFPAEAGILERAVSFAKGCYPGQETVARMYYRGHPNRTLRRFVLEGALPQPGEPILQGGKQVGRITSIAPLPVAGKNLALGYLHRNANPETPLKAGEARISSLSES